MRDAVAAGGLGNAGTELDDPADALVPGDERRCGLHRPVAVGGVYVGVAQPRRLHLDQDLARLELAPRHLLDAERRAEVVNYRGVIAGDGRGRLVWFRGGDGHESLLLLDDAHLPGRAGSVIRRRTQTVRGQVLSRDGPLRLAHEMLVAAEVVALPSRRSDAGFGGP